MSHYKGEGYSCLITNETDFLKYTMSHYKDKDKRVILLPPVKPSRIENFPDQFFLRIPQENLILKRIKLIRESNILVFKLIKPF